MKKIKPILYILLFCFLFIICPKKCYCASKKVKILEGDKVTKYNTVPYDIVVKGKKIKNAFSPAFFKDNEYYGSVDNIFINSPLMVKKINSENGITLVYGSKMIEICDGEYYVYQKSSLDKEGIAYKIRTKIFQGTYYSTKKDTWFVPIQTICYYLGISYSMKNKQIVLNDLEVEESIKKEMQKIKKNKKNRILIMIDAGHGGIDVGNKYKNVLEKDFNLLASKMITEKLKNNEKYYVVNIRNRDKIIDFNKCISYLENLHPDMIISMHGNNNNTNEINFEYNIIYNQEGKYTNSETLVNKLNESFPKSSISNHSKKNIIKYSQSPICIINFGVNKYLNKSGNLDDTLLKKDVNTIVKTIENLN